MSDVRYLNLKREKRFAGSLIPYEINIDGNWVAKLENGDEINIPLDYSKHEFYMKFDGIEGAIYSEGLIIPADSFNHSLYCYCKAGLMKPKLLWEIDQDQEECNKRVYQEEMHKSSIIDEINGVLALIEEGKLIGCRDYSALNQLSEDAKKSSMYAKWLDRTKRNCISMILKQYIEGKWGYERVFKPIHDLCTIPELKNECLKYLRHFDYYVKSRGALNSVLNEENPVDEIIELSKSSRDINDYISDNICEEMSNIKTYYKSGENEKALECLLLVNIDEKDLWNLKKGLIISAMTEGITKEETEKYTAVEKFYKYVYLMLDDEKEESIHVNTVDEIIAETIRCSYSKVFTKLNEMLDEFLEYTCRVYKIQSSQYNILQKIFAYFKAYDQEKRILENMVNNYITRSSEQEERLAFLQKGNYDTDSLANVNGQKDDFIEDSTWKYEYRSVNWDSKKIETFFENLSLQNRTVEYPFVVREWNKEINIFSDDFDIDKIGQLICNAFIDNYDNRFSIRLAASKTMDNYSEPMDTITIVADSDEEITKGYSWIAYFVTAEKISNKQVAFSIYTLYFPALDMEVKLAQDSLIRKNKLCANKIILLKEMQNPRINRHIQSVNNLIINVLENWVNNENKKTDIYG